MKDPVVQLTRYLVIRAAACVVVCGLLAAIDQAVTMRVTLESVTPESRGIVVSYTAGAETHNLSLDVSRKAEITLNGSQVALASLGPQQEVMLEYDKRLAVVTKIAAKGPTQRLRTTLDVHTAHHK